ncbi:hypothetical protein H6G93_10140 [Nostoc sp. FACHB-973]|nr:hypothetical protein [Nostoc sp. FACHB-973]
MQQWLHASDVRLIGVTATGGYGKSALVAKLCETVAAGFPQQLWVSFSDAYPFAVWGRWLLDKLEKPAPEKPEDLLVAVCHCLQTEKYLLVLDNLETLLQDDGQWRDEVYAQFWARWFGSRSEEALEHYQQALQFYRDIGDRLGEANVLQEFGKLQENPTIALDYLQQAQNLYIQIGSIYNQSRNLLFIANVQLNMGDSNAAINSLNHAAELAATINYAPLQEYAQTRIAKINSSPAPTNGIKERFIQFIQQPWVKFAFCFLVGLIAFVLLRR